MRFLRMLTNSLFAGALGAAYLAILILQLNPDVPLLSATPWWWFVTLAVLYGAVIAVTSYVLVIAREFFAMDVLSPGWISVRVLAWLGAGLAAVAAMLMWLNVRAFESAIGEIAARRMTAGATATSASALILLTIAVVHFSFGRRGSRVGATLFVLAVVASIALPIAARGPATATLAPLGAWTTQARAEVPGPRVTVIALDGASLGYIMPRAAEGRLPNFSRALDAGALINLASVRPTQPDPVWAAVATGMYPAKNGVRSAAVYFARRDRRGVDMLPDYCLSHALVHLGFVNDRPAAADQWAARPLWGILSDAGVSVGVVRWPLTHPAQAVRGFIASDRLHHLVTAPSGAAGAVYPPDTFPFLQAAAHESFLAASDASTAAGFAAATPESAALRRDLLYARMARALSGERPPRFLTVRYDGLDVVGHYYLRYSQPPTPRGVREDVRRRYAQVMDRYYAYIDSELGAALDAAAPGDLVVVVAGFGMDALSPLKRTLGRALGDPEFTGTHERAPEGFLLAYGSHVRRGRYPRGSLVDVAPTLLYFFGLPVARDMDGFARSDLFTREFSGQRPITFIPSYR
jgi:predicted AlkP superfamily phosphohydrolase/phosphomutase